MFIRLRQWVSHVMDHYWRRRTVRLRKKQNVAACKCCGHEPLPMYLKRQRDATP